MIHKVRDAIAGGLRWAARRLIHLAMWVESTASKRKRDGEVVGRLLESSRRLDSFSDLTDWQVGRLVLNAWMSTSVLSEQGDVLSEAIDRLHRAGGGPMSAEEQKRIWAEQDLAEGC